MRTKAPPDKLHDPATPPQERCTASDGCQRELANATGNHTIGSVHAMREKSKTDRRHAQGHAAKYYLELLALARAWPQLPCNSRNCTVPYAPQALHKGKSMPLGCMRTGLCTHTAQSHALLRHRQDWWARQNCVQHAYFLNRTQCKRRLRAELTQ